MTLHDARREALILSPLPFCQFPEKTKMIINTSITYSTVHVRENFTQPDNSKKYFTTVEVKKAKVTNASVLIILLPRLG